MLALGFAVASLLIFWFGDGGVLAYERLSRYRDRVQTNVDDLSRRNAELSSELSSLQTDPERTQVLARDLGLYNGDDRVIRLEGAPARTSFFDVGNLLKLTPSKAEMNPVYKIIGLSASGALFLLLFVLRPILRKRLRGGKTRDYSVG